MDGLPPDYYNYPYNGPVIEQVLPLKDVIQVCQAFQPIKNTDLKACILFTPNFKGDACYIVLPKIGIGGVEKRYQDILRKHEIGHCNGWNKDHNN